MASAMGAVKSGSGTAISYALYVYESLRTLYQWLKLAAKSITTTELALCCLLPYSLGGLGISPIMSLTANITGNALDRALGMLRVMAFYEPDNRALLTNLVNQPVDKLSDLDFLRDPTQVHVSGPRIRTQRMKIACLDAISRLAINPTLRDLLVIENELFYLELAKSLRGMGTVNVLEVTCEWSKTKRAKAEAIASKFQKSDTILAILGPQIVSKLRRMHRRDALSTVMVFRYRIMGQEIPKVVSTSFAH
jgi:hypothetical protein